MITISKMQEMDVIDINDGKKIGNVKDIEINLRDGKVTAVILPEEGNFLRFFKKEYDQVIPMSHIIKIGEDIILVDGKNLNLNHSVSYGEE